MRNEAERLCSVAGGRAAAIEWRPISVHARAIVNLSDESRERLLTRLRAYRVDLEQRIAFLESNEAEIRFKHEGEWVDATPTVVAALYRQYGDLGALINDIAAGRP